MDFMLYICMRNEIVRFMTQIYKIMVKAKFNFKRCLDLLAQCTSALYAHDEDLTDDDLIYCDFLRSVCVRYLEVYSSEIRLMYRTSSVVKDSPEEK